VTPGRERDAMPHTSAAAGGPALGEPLLDVSGLCVDYGVGPRGV
jgi:hypothetical protein